MNIALILGCLVVQTSGVLASDLPVIESESLAAQPMGLISHLKAAEEARRHAVIFEIGIYRPPNNLWDPWPDALLIRMPPRFGPPYVNLYGCPKIVIQDSSEHWQSPLLELPLPSVSPPPVIRSMNKGFVIDPRFNGDPHMAQEVNAAFDQKFAITPPSSAVQAR